MGIVQVEQTSAVKAVKTANTADAPVPPLWSVVETLDYLDKYEATIIHKSGELFVQFPPSPNRDKIIEAVLPHLKANKPELELHWRRVYPGLFEKENKEQARARLIREAIARGATINKQVFFLARNGACVGPEEKPLRKTYTKPRKRKVCIPISRSATHVCLAGEEWTPLPKVTTAEEDAEFVKGDTAHRARGSNWNKPEHTLYDELD